MATERKTRNGKAKIRTARQNANLRAGRKARDDAASIDAELAEALGGVDEERKARCRDDFVSFCREYGVGTLLETPYPKPYGERLLNAMAASVTSHANLQCLVGRGSGKSTAAQLLALWCILYGKHKFVMIIGANARQAASLKADLYRLLMDGDSAISHDFPEACLPFQIANGSNRKRMLYGGRIVQVVNNAESTTFADLGESFACSDAVIATRGCGGSVRGTKHGATRPGFVIIDDLQTAESADNPLTVNKNLDYIRKEVYNLSGRKRISILALATPICADDVTFRLKEDKAWKTELYPALITPPRNAALWAEYFRIYDGESATAKPHGGSLAFYRANRAAMDDGAELFNPSRYSEDDGDISGLQRLMRTKHDIGETAFGCEYQMQCRTQAAAIDLSPSMVVRNTGEYSRLEIPPQCVMVAAATDLNVSHALTTALVAFRADMTAFVIWHEITRCRVDLKQSESAYTRAVYEELARLGKSLSGLGVRIDGWAIDCGGTNWEAVNQFAKNSRTICGLSACAFAGRAATNFNPLSRSRLRSAQGRTLLCGDAREQAQSGSGYKYVLFDADAAKEAVQRAFLSTLGNIGSMTLYADDAAAHSDFAVQVTNERLLSVMHKADGRSVYVWKSREPHDYLDCLAMCHAVAEQGALAPMATASDLQAVRRAPMLKRARKQYRFV